MSNAAMNRTGRSLRLVVDNADPRPFLMPILDVERRLAAVERRLRQSDLADDRREALVEMRTLLRCELAARPFNPTLARRCEHRLRWIERRLPGADRPETLLGRARAALSAILPIHLANA